MRIPAIFLIVAASFVLAGTAAAGDLDGDGVADASDNCVGSANPGQTDSNNNGLGNACDLDYNGDGLVDAADAELLKAAIGAGEEDAAFDFALDVDGDGVIGGSDWALFVTALNGR